MTLAEYASALAKLPASYKGRPFDEVTFCEFRDSLFITHLECEPLRYRDGAWEAFIIVNADEGMAFGQPPDGPAKP